MSKLFIFILIININNLFAQTDTSSIKYYDAAAKTISNFVALTNKGLYSIMPTSQTGGNVIVNSFIEYQFDSTARMLLHDSLILVYDSNKVYRYYIESNKYLYFIDSLTVNDKISFIEPFGNYYIISGYNEYHIVKFDSGNAEYRTSLESINFNYRKFGLNYPYIFIAGSSSLNYVYKFVEEANYIYLFNYYINANNVLIGDEKNNYHFFTSWLGSRQYFSVQIRDLNDFTYPINYSNLYLFEYDSFTYGFAIETRISKRFILIHTSVRSHLIFNRYPFNYSKNLYDNNAKRIFISGEQVFKILMNNELEYGSPNTNWQFRKLNIITNVKETNINIYNFKLDQNYPNPFNPVTVIQFTIPNVMLSSSNHDDATLRQAQSDILVSLKVYDILGNEVATLVDEEKPSGDYNVEFDATGYTSGIYFYVLTSGSNRMTKKMVLLK